MSSNDQELRDELHDIQTRLIRLETKVIRGFEELGADTNQDPNWLDVEGDCIHINTMGRSLQVITATAKKKGAQLGKRSYSVLYRGTKVATI